MDHFTEKHIRFFDCASLFADLWRLNRGLKIDFILSTLPRQTKVIFTLETDSEQRLINFQQHALRFFQPYPLVSEVCFGGNKVEVFMRANLI